MRYQVTGPGGTHTFTTNDGAMLYIGAMCSFFYYVPAQFAITVLS